MPVLGLEAAVEVHPLQGSVHGREGSRGPRDKPGLWKGAECVNVSSSCDDQTLSLVTHRVQTQRVSLQHGLLPVRGLLVLQVAPGLPALDVGEPPAAQVCGRLRPVGPSSAPQVPGDTAAH